MHSQKLSLSMTQDLNDINKILNTILQALLSRKHVENFIK